MRILHLLSHLNTGGVSRYALTLAQALRARGHHVTLASDGGQLEAMVRESGLAWWPLPLHTSVEFSPQVGWAARQLARRLRRDPVNLLHAHTRVGQVIADRLARRLSVPYVATWHGFFRRNLGRSLWPCTGDLTVAISEPVRQHLMREFRVPASRIRLIPHGIDAEQFARVPDPDTQRYVRDQARLDAGATVIGTVARLVASKGVDQLIRSMADIRAAIPGAQLMIVGDGEDRPRLERLARRIGVSRVVRFAGALSETRVALSLMRVFVFLPAEQEGFGLSLLEAMASGCPIVAIRRGGGSSWVLEESGVGALVEPNAPGDLARAVIRVLRDPASAFQAAARARAVVIERYALTRMVDQVEAVYRELTGRE